MKQYDPVLFKKFCEEVIPKLREKLQWTNKKGKIDGKKLRGAMDLKEFKIYLNTFLECVFNAGEEWWSDEKNLDRSAEFFTNFCRYMRERYEPEPSGGWPWKRKPRKKTCKKPPTG